MNTERAIATLADAHQLVTEPLPDGDLHAHDMERAYRLGWLRSAVASALRDLDAPRCAPQRPYGTPYEEPFRWVASCDCGAHFASSVGLADATRMLDDHLAAVPQAVA